MKVLLWNVLLAIVWAAINGRFTGVDLATGFVLAYLVLGLLQRVLGTRSYFVKVPQVLRFGLFYAWKLLQANVRIAYEVVTPGYQMRPGVIAIPLDAKKDSEIITLANLITMTPGTLSLDVSTDRETLYVHAMYVADVNMLKAEIKADLERRIIEMYR